ncbi:hypothetical protein MCEREM21A_00950 [Sphingomonadaceae bacterium]
MAGGATIFQSMWGEGASKRHQVIRCRTLLSWTSVLLTWG